jgi:chemotaxis protein methyltransferase WspC
MTRPEKHADADCSAEALLAERIGLDPRAVGSDTIARALRARMSALGLDSQGAYLQRLAGSPDEQQELIEEVVIPESWFFRDDRPFAVLRSHALARGHGDLPVAAPALRVLSIPCACGEEPYSIAMVLLELGIAPGRFAIDAVDVSARHLAVAERGIYRANAFRGADLAFRDRYFRAGPHAESYTLDPSVRALVRFTRGNLVDASLLSGQPPYDVIFCRNVLIYLDAAARRRAFATLDRLLAPDGLLFVGHAERLAIDEARFEAWGENAGFTLRRARPKPPAIAPRRTEPAVRTRTPARPAEVQRATPQPQPQPPVVDALPESSTTLLDEAAALADRGRNDEAAERCQAALDRFGPSARAFFLLGLVRQAAGRLAEAEASFRKTIYLEPAHDEALFALALLAQRRGDLSAAEAFRRRAERARARTGRPTS